MNQWKNVMEVFKLLEKSNCGQCGMPTCLAFAAAVFQGRKELVGCARLDDDIVRCFAGNQSVPEPSQDEIIEPLKEKIRETDLAAAAKRLGARFDGEKLTLKVLGKDFSVDARGNMISAIHVNQWVAGPVLDCILHGAGKPVSDQWVAFRELKSAKSWVKFFERQCEIPFKKVADSYTDLFEDMIRIFNGKQVENHYVADISLVLYPLPNLPILFCYWKPEDGLDSTLNLFFDSTASENLSVDYIYMMGTGLVRMFEKIARTHGA